MRFVTRRKLNEMTSLRRRLVKWPTRIVDELVERAYANRFANRYERMSVIEQTAHSPVLDFEIGPKEAITIEVGKLPYVLVEITNTSTEHRRISLALLPRRDPNDKALARQVALDMMGDLGLSQSARFRIKK